MGIVRRKLHNGKRWGMGPPGMGGKGWPLIFFIAFLLFWAPAVRGGEIRISGAASTKDVLTECARIYKRSNPSASVIQNFGASGTLAIQIENGAPTDIFISASREWVDYLAHKKLVVPEKIRPFAGNVLVFVGRSDVHGFQDLGKLERIAIASPRSAPAGAYAVEALEKSGWLPKLQKKLILARDVREALAYAERGEVGGAFVYRSDALLAKKAKVLFVVPSNLHAPILYPMAMTPRGSVKEGAVAYYQFLQGDTVRGVLKRYGFTAPPSP
jgi:molybdate transport system substrate-binding protein